MNRTDDSETAYRPISCAAYSALELAIISRRRLRLMWHAGNVCFVYPVMPLDLETKSGREFLHGRLPSGERIRVRLDHIARMEPA